MQNYIRLIAAAVALTIAGSAGLSYADQGDSTAQQIVNLRNRILSEQSKLGVLQKQNKRLKLSLDEAIANSNNGKVLMIGSAVAGVGIMALMASLDERPLSREGISLALSIFPRGIANFARDMKELHADQNMSLGDYLFSGPLSFFVLHPQNVVPVTGAVGLVQFAISQSDAAKLRDELAAFQPVIQKQKAKVDKNRVDLKRLCQAENIQGC